MASTYVHLSGRDIDSALLKLSGIPVESENKKDEFQVKICPRCRGKIAQHQSSAMLAGFALMLKQQCK